MGSGSSRPSHSANDNKKLYNRLHTSENEDWSGEIDDQETTSTSSPLSNGRIVRFVGRNRIEDGCLTTGLTVLAFPVLVPIQCSIARARRQSWAEVFFQLFSIGQLPNFARAARSLLLPEMKPSSYLRFVCISDTHMQHDRLKLPSGDVLIHSGDFTNHGSLKEIQVFAAWLETLDFEHIIIVPGNHDMILDKEYYEDYWSDWSRHKEDPDEALRMLTCIPNVKVLIDQQHEINGISIWGSPWVTQHGGWKTGFNKKSFSLDYHWTATLPDQVDILVTHSPCKGVADMEPLGHAVGCPHLLDAVNKIQPQYHVVGHIHSDYGIHKYSYGGTAINASSVTDFYYTAVRDPVVFDLAKPT